MVRRIEEADELRRVAEQEANKSRAMAEAALTELIQVNRAYTVFPLTIWVSVFLVYHQ